MPSLSGTEKSPLGILRWSRSALKLEEVTLFKFPMSFMDAYRAGKNDHSPR